MNKEKQILPNFLGIGAPRAGTSWLSVNLRKHPDIWMPHIKELHYFDRSLTYPTPTYLACKWPFKRFFGSEEHNVKFRRKFKKTITNDIKNRSWVHIAWDINYFFGVYNDKWYMSLFRQGNFKIKGEITPAYSILKTQDVVRLKRLMPQVKIIYLIRNPIDRTWSHIRRLEMRDNFIFTSLTFKEQKNFVNKPEIALPSDYIRTLSIWSDHFTEKQFFIGFYDEIEKTPIEFLKKIFDFLNIKNFRIYFNKSAFDRINASPMREAPMDLKLYLAEKYHSQVLELKNMLNGFTEKWIRDMETIREIR